MVMSKTPATMVAAPTMMRKFTVSILRRKMALKSTVNSGVVLTSGIITESWPRPRAMKFATCADVANEAAQTKKIKLRGGMRNWEVRLVVNANNSSKVSDTVVTTATATKGS